MNRVWVLHFAHPTKKYQVTDPDTHRNSVKKPSHGGTYATQMLCCCSAQRWMPRCPGSRWCQSGWIMVISTTLLRTTEDSKLASNTIHLICNGCFEDWWVPAYRTEDSTPLGHGLVAVPYPQAIYPHPHQTSNRNKCHQPESTCMQKQSRGASSKGKHTMGGPTKGGSSKVKPTNTDKTPNTTYHLTLPTDATLHPPLSEVMGCSNSLPITSTMANPHSSRLSIRLPPRPTSTSGLSVQGLSPSDRSRSAMATPPPPSPQEPPVTRRTASSNSLCTEAPHPAQKRASNSALHPRAAKRLKPEEGDED